MLAQKDRRLAVFMSDENEAQREGRGTEQGRFGCQFKTRNDVTSQIRSTDTLISAGLTLAKIVLSLTCPSSSGPNCHV